MMDIMTEIWLRMVKEYEANFHKCTHIFPPVKLWGGEKLSSDYLDGRGYFGFQFWAYEKLIKERWFDN